MVQLRGSIRENECYGISYRYKNRPQESVYLNCTLKGKVARWKLYIQNWNFSVSWEKGQEEHQQVPDKLYRLVSNPKKIRL